MDNYPVLFHKQYYLKKTGCSSKRDQLPYRKIISVSTLESQQRQQQQQQQTLTGKNEKQIEKTAIIFHFHVFQLENLNSFFDVCLSTINEKIKEFCQHFPSTWIETTLIITYCRSRAKCFSYQKYQKLFTHVSLLLCNNCGMDIGAKMCCVHYLQKNLREKMEQNSIENRNCDPMIFFFHSKRNSSERERLINPFYNYFDEFLHLEICRPSNSKDSTTCSMILSENIQIGDIPGIVHEYSDRSKSFEYNSEYSHELLSYATNNKFDFTEKFGFAFPEGSFFGLRMSLAFQLYCRNDDYFWNLYETLNDDSSFDFLWFTRVYKKEMNGLHINASDIESVTNFFQREKSRHGSCMFGNNLTTRNPGSNPNGIFPDGMVEHAFERVPLAFALLKSNDDIHILGTLNCFHSINMCRSHNNHTKSGRSLNSLCAYINNDHRQELISSIVK